MKLTLMVVFCCMMLLSSPFSSSATVVAEDKLEGAQTTSQEKASFITTSNSIKQSSETMRKLKEVRVSTKAKLLRFLLSKLHVRHLSRYYRQAVTDDVAKQNRYMNYLRLITVLGLSIIYFFVMNSQL